MMRLFAFVLLSLIYCASSAQTIVDFNQSDCGLGDDDSKILKERVMFREYSNSELAISFLVQDNCCIEAQEDFTLTKDTLFLKYVNVGDECFCHCFYEISYRIENLDIDPKLILLNGKQYPETNQKFVIKVLTVDTLDNGIIQRSYFQDNILTTQIETRDTVSIFRRFEEGILVDETLFKK